MKTKNIHGTILRLCALCFLLPFLFLPAVIHAETDNIITLKQAVEMALKNDLKLELAQNDIKKAQMALKQEIIKIYPQFTVEDSLGWNLNDIGEFPNSLTVTVKEALPTKFNIYGKKVPNNIEVAAWDLLSNESQLQIAQANVIYNTISLYLNALKTGKSMTLQEVTVKNNQTSLMLAKEQLKMGKITKPTELKAENDLANAVYNLEKSRSDYNLVLRQLGNQIGLKEVNVLKLVDVSEEMLPDVINWQQLETQASQKREELKQSQITIQKSERQLAQMQNQALPDLNLSYNNATGDKTWNFGVNYSFLSGNINGTVKKTFSNSVILPNPGETDINTFALKFSWSADFGTAKNQIEQAKLGLENAINSRKQTLQGIEWDIEQARANYELARQKLDINEQAIAFYQKQMEIALLQYKLGSVTQLEVANNEANLLQAQLQVTNSKYDLLLAYQKLRLACGDLYQFGDK
jgi:outer membrane protein